MIKMIKHSELMFLFSSLLTLFWVSITALTCDKAVTMLKSPAVMVYTIKLANVGIYDHILKVSQSRTLSPVSAIFCFLAYQGMYL